LAISPRLGLTLLSTLSQGDALRACPGLLDRRTFGAHASGSLSILSTHKIRRGQQFSVFSFQLLADAESADAESADAESADAESADAESDG
jgi:hypothetical protein